MMTVTIGPRAALRTALWIVWQVVRHPRTAVTFEAGSRWERPVSDPVVPLSAEEAAHVHDWRRTPPVPATHQCRSCDAFRAIANHE